MNKENTYTGNIASEAVLLSTHIINDFVLDKYRRLRSDLSEKYDVILLLNKDEEEDIKIPEDIRIFTTDCDSLNALEYNPIEETLLPGSCHFPLLRFFIDHPHYDNYWFVEYDVEFTGNWSVLMDDVTSNLSDYDFLSCYVERFNTDKNGHWPWWYRGNDVGYPLQQCIKGFNPICRCSYKALKCLDIYQKEGHSAHSEVMITSCLFHHGMKIGDFGGNSEFVPDGYEDKFYLANPEFTNGGTMRYRPLYTMQEIEEYNVPNKLFHPIKNKS